MNYCGLYGVTVQSKGTTCSMNGHNIIAIIILNTDV